MTTSIDHRSMTMRHKSHVKFPTLSLINWWPRSSALFTRKSNYFAIVALNIKTLLCDVLCENSKSRRRIKSHSERKTTRLTLKNSLLYIREATKHKQNVSFVSVTDDVDFLQRIARNSRVLPRSHGRFAGHCRGGVNSPPSRFTPNDVDSYCTV